MQPATRQLSARALFILRLCPAAGTRRVLLGPKKLAAKD